jgi:hypothetical protein
LGNGIEVIGIFLPDGTVVQIDSNAFKSAPTEFNGT